MGAAAGHGGTRDKNADTFVSPRRREETSVMSMADEIPESEEEKRAKRKAVMENVDRWAPGIDALFAHPEGPHTCPLCGRPSVRAAWGLFHNNPRTAGFDAWCENCNEKTHCTALLPPD